MTESEVLPKVPSASPAEATPSPIEFRPGASTAYADPIFVTRWSPRSFLDRPVPAEDLQAVLDAARWAPSSNNAQPWLIAYAVKEEDRARFASALVPFNQAWAGKAPVLLYLVARNLKGPDGQASPYPIFDSGAAWMSMAIQAHLRGLYTHAMGGFDPSTALKVLGLPEDEYRVLAVIALGFLGDPSALPEQLALRERPNGRKALSDIAYEGRPRPTLL